jgi:hypothetical protein
MSGAGQNNRAERYRSRAEELRMIAQGLKSSEREILLQVAQEYDDMAVHAELLERDRSVQAARNS